MNLENGKQFIIDAPQNNEKNLYIQSALLRGVEYDKNYLDHSDILKGGTLQFNMGEKPNLKRGIGRRQSLIHFRNDDGAMVNGQW